MNLNTFKLLFLFTLVGCTTVKRPEALICGINAKSQVLRCYNLKIDYDETGTMKPDAKPTIKPIASFMDLNAGIYVSPKDFKEIKKWIGELRNYYDKECR